MSGDVTYRQPRLCSDCWAPWSGQGPVCNACKQIAALKEVAKSNELQNQSLSSYSSSEEGLPSLVGIAMIFIAFFYICYLTNWIPFKIMWWIITGLVSAAWWILKVLFYLTFY